MKTNKPINIYACHLHDGKREAIAVQDVLSITNGSPTDMPRDYRVSMLIYVKPGNRRHEWKKYLQPFKRLQELYTYAYRLQTLHEALYEREWYKYAFRHINCETVRIIHKSYNR